MSPPIVGAVTAVPPREGEPYRHREVAESFGSDAERYDRTRPPYPDAMVGRIVAAIPGPDVLDVGCGTGIAARQFQAAGCRVLGVEPDARMADFARCRGVEVEVAAFEGWDSMGRSFDAVIAGQAWHWVDPVAGAAKAAQVLRPGGRLAPFWHVYQPPREVTEAFVTVYQRVVPESPVNLQAITKPLDAYQALVSVAVDGMRDVGGFSDPEQWRFDWEQPYTRDAWLDELRTLGILSQLRPDELAEVLEEVGGAIDAIGDTFTMRYTTVVVTALVHGAVAKDDGDSCSLRY